MIRILCTLCFALLAFPGQAALAAAAALDPAAVARWADTQFGVPVAQARASAATVVVVQGGKVIFQRDYGHGDRAAGTPIAPPRDRFLIASTTKTFTATAIALLLHDGRIASLDHPANRYLRRLQLPNGFGRAVTIRQLLTHSAGYEERGFGVGNHDDPTAPATAAYVRAHLPAIVRPPGSRIVYANIDPAILGMIVEDITGMTMRDFIAARILRPLGMNDTELAYAPSATARLVRPYTGDRAAAWEVNAPFYAPTGSIHTTAADMAKYLNAQLGHAPSVLAPDVTQRLHAPLARNAPLLDPLAMAFFVSRWNGQAIVGHAGGFSGFSADLWMLPGRDIGVFYAWAGAPASGGGEPLDYGRLQASFLRLALGAFRPPVPVAVQPDPSAFYGRYWNERRPQTTFESIIGAGDVQTVGSAPGNRLTIDGRGPYYAFVPGVYSLARADGRPGNIVAFDGERLLERVGYARRVRGWSDPGTQTMLAGAALALLATGLPGAIWMRARARWIAPLIGLAALVVPLVLYALPPGLEAAIIAGREMPFIALRLIIVAIILLAAGLAVTAARRGARVVERVHALLLLLAALALVPPFAFFHLL